jgi:hypothetical protein
LERWGFKDAEGEKEHKYEIVGEITTNSAKIINLTFYGA